MNCFDFESKMGGYLDQSLPGAEIDEISSHLSTCSTCSVKLAQTQRIGRLFRKQIFPEPGEDYWEKTPMKIVRRLGLHPKITLWQQLLDQLGGLFASPAFRVAVAGAFTVALFFLLSNYWRGVESVAVRDSVSDHVQVQKEPVDLPSQDPPIVENLEQSLPTLVAGSDAANADPPETAGVQKQEAFEPGMEPLAYRSLLQVPFESGTAHELIPIANSLFLLSSDDTKDDGDRRNLSTSSFGADVLGNRGKHGARGQARQDVPDQDSDFAETAWIVQESQSLSEKKSIWLSFMAREKDPTYLSLGIYNLALVLSRIAEESRDQQSAQEALQFFVEHETSLRFQMNDGHYDAKMKTLRLIAADH